MATRRILLLNSSGLACYRWLPGGPVLEESFTDEAQDIQRFDAFLNEYQTSLFYLIADVADEGFQIDQMPAVRGADREQMLKRKLAQLYYGTPLSLALSLGKAADGRRDEQILFAGLTGYTLFEPWLQVLRDAEAQLIGIYSMPQAIAAAVAKLPMGDEPILLLTATLAGLRQTFFDRGQLRFSRLSALSTSGIGDLAIACGTESRKIRQYLAGHRLIPRDAPLKTLVLAHPAHFGAIAERCLNTPEQSVQMIDIIDISRKLGLKEAPRDSFSDRLFVHQLVRRKPGQQFAPAQELRPYHLWQTKLLINSLAGVLLAGSLLYAGIQVTRHLDLSTDNELLQTELDLGKRRYDAQLKELPGIPIKYEDLRLLADRYQALDRTSPGPTPLLTHISHAVTESPKIDLNRLEWWISDDPNQDAATGGATQNGSTQRGGQAARGGGYAIVRLQGQLPPSMAGDHRSQLDTVDSFADMLRAEDIQVRVVTLPFETESGKSIRSGDPSGHVEPPRFVVKLVQKL